MNSSVIAEFAEKAEKRMKDLNLRSKEEATRSVLDGGGFEYTDRAVRTIAAAMKNPQQAIKRKQAA